MDNHQDKPSPSDLGFRMPAEWEPQESIWLSWPHNEATWPGAFEPVPGVFAQIAKHVSEGQLVRINVLNQEMAENVKSLIEQAGGRTENLRFHINPTNDSWVRDHGPIYLVRDQNGRRERAISNWIYNSWGEKYPPFDSDNRVPRRIAEEFQELCFDQDMVLEGGSIDVNGEGTLLTTTSCLLNPNRNAHLSTTEIEAALKAVLGVSQILWLGDGILGDDTDGHIDDITRFVSANRIVTAVESNESDPNFEPLHKNLELLKSMKNLDGEPFEIVELPMPAPRFFDSQRLPASYANFLITNQKVLVPVYRCDADQVAIDILSECLPDREVVGIDCTDLVWGLGAIHCVTQQQPIGEIVPADS
ncbi:agmatine deiminase family protein [Thalassoglobus sp. JC818]|uniref:agmatine deiminase family protein n=1 Tax=Thalassoglobus sp. JC818 TaxID=3232136 RepID=UPI00345AF43D